MLLTLGTDASSDARTSVSLTSLTVATLHRPAMAPGKRPENSMPAQTLYTCFTLHNEVGRLTDRLLCCVDLYVLYNLINNMVLVNKEAAFVRVSAMR